MATTAATERSTAAPSGRSSLQTEKWYQKIQNRPFSFAGGCLGCLEAEKNSENAFE
jgi:hypothetical protein